MTPFKDKEWIVTDTANEDVTLTGLDLVKQYLIRYRIVDRVGMSVASDTERVSLCTGTFLKNLL